MSRFNRYNADMELYRFAALLFADLSVGVAGCCMVWVYEKVYNCYDHFRMCYCINFMSDHRYDTFYTPCHYSHSCCNTYDRNSGVDKFTQSSRKDGGVG